MPSSICGIHTSTVLHILWHNTLLRIGTTLLLVKISYSLHLILQSHLILEPYIQIRNKLLKQNQIYTFVTTYSNLAHKYLGYNVVASLELVCNMSPIKEVSGETKSIIYSTHYINRAILWTKIIIVLVEK